jgi:hypothetical protein
MARFTLETIFSPGRSDTPNYNNSYGWLYNRRVGISSSCTGVYYYMYSCLRAVYPNLLALRQSRAKWRVNYTTSKSTSHLPSSGGEKILRRPTTIISNYDISYAQWPAVVRLNIVLLLLYYICIYTCVCTATAK